MTIQNDQERNHEALPWYRYGMVWFVVLLPVAVVIASIFTMVIAHQHAPQLVNKQSADQTYEVQKDTRLQNKASVKVD